MKKFIVFNSVWITIICVFCVSLSWSLDVPNFEKVVEAMPDECFVDMWQREAKPPSNEGECDQGGPKTNQTYIWSLAGDSEKIWFGTLANGACQVMSVAMFAPFKNDCMTCEFFMGPSGSDWRPPQIFSYDPATEELEKHSITSRLDPCYHTLGWRSAIIYKDKVFFAGPSRFAKQSLNLLVMDKNGNHLKSKVFLRYVDARKWLIGSDGKLYLGVGKKPFGGAILRWVEDKGFFEEVGAFEEAGRIRNQAGWIEEYKGRIYAITWGGDYLVNYFGIWQSPPLSELSGFLSTRRWKKIWEFEEYTGQNWFFSDHALIGGGAMKTFKGIDPNTCEEKDYLYFGTMTSVVAPFINSPPTPPASLFRLYEEGGKIDVELLIGEPQNGYTPLLNPEVFPKFYHEGNKYIWSMEEHDGLLYIGTLNLTPEGEGLPEGTTTGFHLWATNGGTGVEDWERVTKHGFGNYLNYGCRQLLSTGDTLWVGTANLANLDTEWHSDWHRGWELWKSSTDGDPGPSEDGEALTLPPPENFSSGLRFLQRRSTSRQRKKSWRD